MKIVELKVADLTAYAKNAKRHPQEQIDNVAESIRQFGMVQPIVVDKDNVVVIGHCRLLACSELGMDTVPCVRVDDLTDEQVKKLRLIDNKTNESPWDFAMLELDMEGLDFEGFDLDFGLALGTDVDPYDNDGVQALGENKGALAGKFLVPPFSVIITAKQDWLARKRKWVDFGIRSELGRGGDLCYTFPSGWADKVIGGNE